MEQLNKFKKSPPFIRRIHLVDKGCDLLILSSRFLRVHKDVKSEAENTNQRRSAASSGNWEKYRTYS